MAQILPGLGILGESGANDGFEDIPLQHDRFHDPCRV